MPNIHTLILGDYQTNCYMVYAGDSKTCAIIDPGCDAPAILQEAERLGLVVEAVLLTHGHFDHVGAVKELVEKTGCSLWISESDWSQPNGPMTHYLYPLANCNFTEVQFCEEGQTITAGGLEFSTLATPGHTRGSVCYLCGDVLFSGDTLFDGSCGRTDLPGGDWGTIQASLQRLSRLPGDHKVCPGHGNSTTLAAQRQYNPYMR